MFAFVCMSRSLSGFLCVFLYAFVYDFERECQWLEEAGINYIRNASIFGLFLLLLKSPPS